MRKIFIYFLISLLAFSTVIYAGQKTKRSLAPVEDNIQKKYKEFFKYFDIQDTLFFNYKNLIIGEISYFLYLGKTCVIFDQMSDSLFYIDMENEKYNSLTTEEILPGYHLNPLALRKINKNSFVVSSDPYHYILFKDGKVERVFKNTKFRASYKFVVGENRFYIYQNPVPEELFLAEMDITTGNTKKLFPLSEVGKNIRNLIFRNPINGGFLYDGKGSFFIADAYENMIYRYDLTGKLINIHKSNYKNFKRVVQDANNSTPGAILNLWQKSRKKPFDVVLSIYLLNDYTILASYSINNWPFIELFNKKNGKIINKKKITIPLPIKYCSDGLLFLECFPSDMMEKENEIKNPYIIKLKYKH